jgi:hypothetical protein
VTTKEIKQLFEKWCGNFDRNLNPLGKTLAEIREEAFAAGVKAAGLKQKDYRRRNNDFFMGCGC